MQMYESQPITPRKSAPYFIDTLQIFLFFKIFAFSLNRQGRNPTICDENKENSIFSFPVCQRTFWGHPQRALSFLSMNLKRLRRLRACQVPCHFELVEKSILQQ